MKFAITTIAVGIGAAFVLAVFLNAGPRTNLVTRPDNSISQPVSTDSQTVADQPAIEPNSTGEQLKPSSDNRDHTNHSSETTTNAWQPIQGLRVVGSDQAQVSRVGSLEKNSGYGLEAELTGWGAGLRYIRLARYRQDIEDERPFETQTPIEAVSATGQTIRMYPFAVRAITVNGVRVVLENTRWSLIQPGIYQVQIVDADGRDVLHLTRQYSVPGKKALYDLRCNQTIENRTTSPLQVVWEQYAQGDLPNDGAAYMGDRRMFVCGYYDLDYNPTRRFVYTKGTYLGRQEVLDGTPLWHGNEDLPLNRELVWFAALNRYFAATVHPVVQATEVGNSKSVVPLDQSFEKIGIQVIGQVNGRHDGKRAMAFTLTSRPIDIHPSERAQLNLALYAGPRKSEVFEAPPYNVFGFAKLVVYELGCTFCTFQPLAKGLLKFLKWIHYLVRDWGVAIIFLVLCVRLVLHPITKRAQINMFKMSKQMQEIQPEIEKLKKKYKNDQQKFQQEQLKLWREKGINPVNMLGCLPMFLQTPIWVALYAMLYLAIELRHEPAFYGVFQAITGGAWHFLADLSSPDNFIRFAGEGYTLNLIFVHPTFAGINILPILMAVVFYFQQKLTTPPPASEQAAQQQKMMKFMVLLFPVMLYSAPSGLTLYILASTAAGIIDSYLVRKHVKEQEEAGTLLVKKERKPGGLMDRIQQAMEAKQREMAQKQASGGGGRATKRRRK